MIRRLLDPIRTRHLLSLEFAALAGAGLLLRFANLGYSNFQGDEIKALCFPSQFASFINFLGFLLTQRKGPVAFIVTCTVGLIDPAFSSELLVRLPFAIASVLGLACTFGLVWALFDRRTAFFGTFLLAANGVLVAFGRIVQY